MQSIGAAYLITPMQTARLKKQNTSYKTFLPSISLDQAEHSYFIHQGHVHSVAGCLTHIFVGAVKNGAPNWGYQKMIDDPHVDLVARWYVLCVLADAGHPLKLYSSRFEAERVLHG